MQINKQDEKLLQELLKKFKQGLISGFYPGDNITFTPTGCNIKTINASGGGGGGTPSSPINSVQYNNTGSFFGDSLFTRDPSTNVFQELRNFTKETQTYNVTTDTVFLISSPTGEFTVGETITGQTSFATATVDVSAIGNNVVLVTITSGTFQIGEQILGGTSGETANIDNVFPDLTIGTNIVVFDLTSGPVGVGMVVGTSPGIVTIITEAILVDGYVLSKKNSPRGNGVMSFTTGTPITTSLLTGLISDNFSGTQGTMFKQKTNSEIAKVGVFDLLGEGYSNTSAVMSSENDSGSINRSILTPSLAEWSMTFPSTAVSLFTMGEEFSSLGSKTSGGSLREFYTQGQNIGWRTTSKTFHLPTSAPVSTSYVLGVASISSNDTYLDWVIPGGGGGGTPGGSKYSIQMNDGASGFEGNNNFQWNYDTDIPTFYGTTGLHISSGTDTYRIGNTYSPDQYNYIDLINNGMGYTNHAITFGPINFTGTGTDNIAYNSYNSYDGTSDTYTITVDGTYSRYDVSSITGTFDDGDTVTNGLGYSATVVRGDLVSGYNQIYLINETGSVSPTDVLTDSATLATLVVDASDGTGDTVTWTDGTTTLNQVPIMGLAASMMLSHNVSVIWSTYTGHNLSDEWTFTGGISAAQKFAITTYNTALGDISNWFFNNSELFSQDLLNGSTTLRTNTLFNVVNGNNVSLFQVSTDNTTAANNFIRFGDFTGSLGAQTFAGLYPTDGIFKIENSGVDYLFVDILNKIYSLGDWMGTGESYIRIDGVNENIGINANGVVTIGDVVSESNGTYVEVDNTNELVKITKVPAYADDAAAISGGLVTGQLYKTTSAGSTFLKIVP